MCLHSRFPLFQRFSVSNFYQSRQLGAGYHDPKQGANGFRDQQSHYALGQERCGLGEDSVVETEARKSDQK